MEFLNNDLLVSLFQAVVPPAVQLGITFACAQFVFSMFMKLAFGNKEGSM